LVLGLILAPLLALAVLRRAYGSLTEAMDEVGATKLYVGLGAATIVGLVPAALGVYGVLSWANGFAISDREKLVECKAGMAWHVTRKGTDLGWHLPYSCDRDGEHLIGMLESKARPTVPEGSAFKIKAARGRLGYWVKLEEPVLTSEAQATP
jgi:hypothetical protein